MSTRGYEFLPSSIQLDISISSWTREDKIRIHKYKHTNDDILDNFLKISEHFPKISKDSSEVVQRPDKQRLPTISQLKITEDFWGRTDGVSIIQQHM